MALQALAPKTDSDNDDTCWLGGECENAPDYDVTHGYEGFYVETHSICKDHIAEAVENLSRPVHGWGNPLPLTIVRRSKGEHQ